MFQLFVEHVFLSVVSTFREIHVQGYDLCGSIRDVVQRMEATSIVIPTGLAIYFSQNGTTVLNQGIHGGISPPFARS